MIPIIQKKISSYNTLQNAKIGQLNYLLLIFFIIIQNNPMSRLTVEFTQKPRLDFSIKLKIKPIDKICTKVQASLPKMEKTNPFDSYFQLMHPKPFHHVYKLFNTFCINQTALEKQDFQQSYFRSIFYHSFVNRVQKYKHAVVMSVSPLQSQVIQPSTQYFIDKLKSQGDRALYEIACQIESIYNIMLQMKSQSKPIIVEEDNQSITKSLNEFAGQMFIYKFKSQKIAISNELLKFMGYDVEEFAVETTKYKNVYVDFLSSNSYSKIIAQAGKIIKLFLTTDTSKFSQEQFLAMTRFQFTDYIYSKDYKKSFCLLQYFVGPKHSVCIRVKKVFNEVNQLQWRPLGGSRSGYENQKKSWIEKENRIYNKLGVIPDNCLQDGMKKMASYKLVEPTMCKKQQQSLK